MPPRRDPLADADDLCKLSATALAQLYARGEASPVEVTRAALARAANVQSRFNAFVRIEPEAALAAAALSEQRWQAGKPFGPLDGIPTTIKDIVWVKGGRARYGSRAPGTDCAEDAPSVALLRAAGAVFLGITTTPEFGWKALTDSPLTGITRNPWNADLTPGGSSGGAAVAAATGAGALHLGTDGGGSIRIPSAFTGIVGHKPTFSRVPAYPASAFGTVAHIGPMARSVADAQLMLQVMSGRDLRDWYQNPPGFRRGRCRPAGRSQGAAPGRVGQAAQRSRRSHHRSGLQPGSRAHGAGRRGAGAGDPAARGGFARAVPPALVLGGLRPGSACSRHRPWRTSTRACGR